MSEWDFSAELNLPKRLLLDDNERPIGMVVFDFPGAKGKWTGWDIRSGPRELGSYYDLDAAKKAVEYATQKDDCEVCHGERGGVKGNENYVNGVVMCDYCHGDTL